MTLFYAVLLFVAGAFLAGYSFETAIDPYWSRRTRVTGVVGTLIGVGCIIFAVVTLMMSGTPT